MKRVVGILSALVFLTAMVVGTFAQAESLAVGIVLPTKDEPRWIQDQTRFEAALKAAGYKVEILFSQGDSAKEKTNVESLITKGVKVIILCPQDGAAAAASADLAKKNGVRIISYDRLITGSKAVDYYVSFDSVAVGAEWGKFLIKQAGTRKNLNLYFYAGAASDNNAFLFFQGAWETLQPKIKDGTFKLINSKEALALKDKQKLTRAEQGKIIGQITTNWDFNAAKSKAEDNLTSAKAADKGEVFIVAPNDGTARAIADAFRADKDVKKIWITGQDAEKASVQYIIDGKQSMTVFKDVRVLVDEAIKAAIAILDGEKVMTNTAYSNGVKDVPTVGAPVSVVEKTTVKKILIDSGYVAASEFTGL